jgi:hypothetical protein
MTLANNILYFLDYCKAVLTTEFYELPAQSLNRQQPFKYPRNSSSVSDVLPTPFFFEKGNISNLHRNVKTFMKKMQKLIRLFCLPIIKIKKSLLQGFISGQELRTDQRFYERKITIIAAQ